MTTLHPPVTGLPLDEVFGHALRGEACFLTTDNGLRHPLPVEDWTKPVDAGDEVLLALCSGPTIDIGCGPGRLTAELSSRGHLSMGIDLVREAVGQTRRRGGIALHRDVFDPIPGEGRWRTALLADGNIGIGGDPAALLDRVRRILMPGGSIVVETAGGGHGGGRIEARLECPCGRSEPFAWAVVTRADLRRVAPEAQLMVVATRDDHGRSVTVLREGA